MDSNNETPKNEDITEETTIEERFDKIVLALENAKFPEYIEMMTNKKRRLVIEFISGLAKGFGMAIGFAVLGAIAIYILSHSFLTNLPVIGKFISEIVKIVQDNLYRR